MVVICVWCVLFVTSHFDVIFMFPNNVLAKFVDTMCIFFYARITNVVPAGPRSPARNM